METTDTVKAIDVRYSELSESTCCLSCGGAIDHGGAMTGEYCLDLGSGRGTDVIRLAEQVGPEGAAYGVDLSEGMVAKARKTAEKLGVANATFIRAEFSSIPLRDGCMDLVISNCAINHAGDKLAVWREVFRLLKNGGRFVVSDIYSTAPVPEEYRTDPAAVAECWAGSVTREEYLAQLREAGFDRVTIVEESAPYPKGEIEVASWTLSGIKAAAAGSGCCCG